MSVSSAATTGRHLGWRALLGSEGRSYTGGYHPPDNTAATRGDCTVLYCTVLYCDQVALQPGPPPGAGAGLAPPHRPHRQPVPPQGPPAHGLPGECRPVRTQVWGYIILVITLHITLSYYRQPSTKTPRRRPQQQRPRKAEISSPCGFRHHASLSLEQWGEMTASSDL